MPKVFLSAAEGDTAFAEKLRRQLKHAVSTVHLGGVQLGSTPARIDDCDGFVLVWSPAAATSPRVAGEWAEALALGKTICIAILAEAALPAELREAQAFPVRPMTDLARGIMSTLWGEQKRNSQVAGVNQSGGENEPVVSYEKPGKSLRWHHWVTGLAALLTIVGLAFDIPTKLAKALTPDDRVKPLLQPIGGTVFDEAGEPLSGVVIVLPEHELQTTTDENGAYRLELEVLPQTLVRIHARHREFRLKRGDVTAGNANHNFKMRRKSP